MIKCNKCGAEIQFIKNAKTGKHWPVNPEQTQAVYVEPADIIVMTLDGYLHQARTLRPGEKVQIPHRCR